MGRAIRWQALIALVGIILLASILASTAFDVSSVTVPVTGGVYTEAVVGFPRGINPLLSYGSDLDRDLSGLLFQGLAAIDERGEVVPALAESWEISPDQRDYTFHLREDVRWHDGAPFTANDVLFTVGVMQSDAFASADFPAPGYLSDLWRSVSAERIDDFTVRFRLQEPYSPFLYENTIGILPEHLWRSVPIEDMPRSILNEQPVGTGPWQLTGMTALSARLEPSSFWQGPDPYLEALELRYYPDYPSAFAAFDAGEVDGVSRILPGNLSTAHESDEMAVFSAPLAGETFVYFNLDNPNTPFLADPEIRQALWLALDIPATIDQALQGQGIPASGPVMPGTWAHVESKKPVADPKSAARMLADAGWIDEDGDGVRQQGEITMSFILLGDDEAVLNSLAEQWARIGVWAKPQVVSLVSLAGDHLATGNYEAALVHWQLSADPDPYPLWHSTQAGDGQNYSGWNHRRADEIMEEGRSVSDPGRRMELYAEFQEIFAEQLPALPLYFDVYNFGVNSKVKDVQVGRLNSPLDRFHTLDQWYIVTERKTVEP
ncbi:MAG: ABC transporter substrate-binding protein [Chloroflexota bacterium]|nr:ABC transporter substrate-binding protein [Chloroflexota bacterium]